MRKAAFFSDQPERLQQVFDQERRNLLSERVDLYPAVVTSESFDSLAGELSNLDVIFSTWGMPRLSSTQVAALPRLEAVFYAAGTVRLFAEPFFARGISIVSAWGANAVPVAEFALAQILLSCKGYFRNSRACRVPEKARKDVAPKGNGAYGELVSVLGAGMVGRTVIRMLRSFALDVMLYDPYVSEAEATELGARKVDLDTAFSEAYVVSNHMPLLPETKHILTGSLFASMREGATFINTARGASVAQDEMARVLRFRDDLTALLDVTDPEPLPTDSALFSLPNVQISTHIAGALGNEVLRLSDWIIEEFDRWEAGLPLRYEITPEMMARLA
jgi:phosphoglycerate dehydrogenase-like enzyme